MIRTLTPCARNDLLRYAALANAAPLLLLLLNNGLFDNTTPPTFDLSPRACAVIGGVGPTVFGLLPAQNDDAVVALKLAKQYGHTQAKRMYMSLVEIIKEQITQKWLLATTKRKRLPSTEDTDCQDSDDEPSSKRMRFTASSSAQVVPMVVASLSGQ